MGTQRVAETNEAQVLGDVRVEITQRVAETAAKKKDEIEVPGWDEIALHSPKGSPGPLDVDPSAVVVPTWEEMQAMMKQRSNPASPASPASTISPRAEAGAND